MSEETVQAASGSTITARHLRNFQVQVIVDRGGGQKGHGPWSLVVDEGPEAGGDGLGPPPVPLAYAALAA